MEKRGSVLVLRFDDTATEDLAKALRLMCWQVRVFDSCAVLLDDLRAHGADVLVLDGAAQGVSDTISMLRGAAPSVALVWRAVAANTSERIAALDAGADVCVAAGMDPLEWDAMLRNLYRRSSPAALPWRVDSSASALSGPAGERLPLTAAERAFFVRLLNAPGYCLRRECFMPVGARASQDGARRVDVLLSRLRSKARSLNIELPVLAVRGWGYILLPEGRASGLRARPGCLDA
ncbi:transcriptional regulator [Achromobacter insolitus]|uniref:transcriptional regulator n=1 Tax=Achromobacter insolitus TaxID=217204 RepID=UPI0028AF337D|nr:transcriptional regulator [Achromobacter insolitus]